jgi:hypothetical protein
VSNGTVMNDGVPPVWMKNKSQNCIKTALDYKYKGVRK